MKYYCVRNINMYQGKNSVNVDINYHTKQITTTTKAVINADLALKIEKCHYGAHKLFLYNRYAWPDIFAILGELIDLIWGGTCRNNIIGFPGDDERLIFPKSAGRGNYRQLYNSRFHLVAASLKDSKTLQSVSSFRKTGIVGMSRRRYLGYTTGFMSWKCNQISSEHGWCRPGCTVEGAWWWLLFQSTL